MVRLMGRGMSVEPEPAPAKTPEKTSPAKPVATAQAAAKPEAARPVSRIASYFSTGR